MMYMRTLFRGAKIMHIRKKRCAFVILTNLGKDMREKEEEEKNKKKKHAKTRHNQGTFSYLKSTCLGCVLKILLGG